nr:ribonuclease H-like domain, reverse transcriptase, RNA-dependent DNA polymerase [Tanacetum cinerariifolium]
MAERRNRSLIEAAKTMLADAKLPVTFWAEAVNTACYVQNRVLVNKAHNKTPYELFNENKAIEKGSGLNLLFDIDSLTKSINYVPVVDVGTNSNNFSGTKVDARQDVKKDVSSLRYIVLPNWVHEEHLESTSSQPQDACNTDAPKSSGNSNPNATPINPPADQLETLIVETLIPTVSLPVPTVCFTNSQEPSSKKDAARQEVKKDVSSLRYIALPNWAHDSLLEFSSSQPQDHYSIEVLECSGNSNPTASTSNPLDDQMETLIVETSIPTNVWNLVDCPKGVRPIGRKWVLKNKKDERGIVIRNKARLVALWHTQEEGIDYDEVFAPVARIEAIRLFLAYASFMGFIVYQMDDLESPAKVYKVEKAMYGLHHAPRAWYGVRPIGTKWVLKNKKDERGIVIRNKTRLVAQGHTQEERIDYNEMDVKSAFLYGIINEEVYVMQRPGFQDLEYPARVYKVEKAMYGLHQAPRAWYGTLSKYLLTNGFQRDSDYGGATQDRKSTTGGCQFLGRRIISWQCKKQTIVATSITEAEYGAAACCCGQVPWIQNQLLDYGLSMPCENLSKEISTSILRLLCHNEGLLQDWLEYLTFELCREFKALMHEKFQMSAMGELNFFLGLQVLQKEDGIFLSQDKYIGDILKKFRFLDVKSSNTPMDKENPWRKDGTGKDNTAVVKRSGDVTRLQALVNKKRIVITKEVVREILQFNDAEGVICLPNEEIFAGLARMGYEKPSTNLTFYKAFFSTQWKFFIHTILHSLNAKRTSWNEFSSAMASGLICLSSCQMFNFSKYIFESLVHNVDSSSKFYMYPRFIQLIIQTNIADLSKHTNRYISPALTQKLEMLMMRKKHRFLLKVMMLKSMLQRKLLLRLFHPSPLHHHHHLLSFHLHLLTNHPVYLNHKMQKVHLICFSRVKKLEKLNQVKSSKLKRLKKVGTLQRVESSDDVENVFNQGRDIDDMDQDEGIELVVDHEKDAEVLSMQEDDTEVQEAVEVVTTAKLITEELHTDTPAETPTVKDKGKGILIEVPKPMKKKDQEAQEADDLKKTLEIVQDEDDDVFVEATLLAQKVPAVDYHGEGSGTPTEPYHIPSQEAQPSSHTHISSPSIPTVTSVPTILIPTATSFETTPFRQYTRRYWIAQSSVLPPVADEPASPLRDVSQRGACPTDSGFIADQDRTTIDKSSTLPHDLAPRVTSPVADEGTQEVEINRLKERVKQLEVREGVAATNFGDDAPIKGRSIDEGEAPTERVSDDTEEMATVLTLMDATTVLASRVVDVPTSSGSIPTASTPAEGSVPTGSEEVPTASPVFATVTVVTPYRRRKGKEVMVESETPKKQKL